MCYILVYEGVKKKHHHQCASRILVRKLHYDLCCYSTQGYCGLVEHDIKAVLAQMQYFLYELVSYMANWKNYESVPNYAVQKVTTLHYQLYAKLSIII